MPAPPGGNRVQVSRARAGTGADQHLVLLAHGDDLVDQRVDGGTTAVDHALTADLEHDGIGQDAEVGRSFRRSLELCIGQ